MKEMILALCGASLCCAFICVLCPDGGLGRCVSLVSSLFVLEFFSQ